VIGNCRRQRDDPMRVLVTVTVLATLMGVMSANAEKRIFIIANNADGYGIDRCLANGSHCGDAAAASYCKSREFAQALSFRKIDRDDITGSVPTGGGCKGKSCDEFVAIECSR
jgi:hypothetical protein